MLPFYECLVTAQLPRQNSTLDMKRSLLFQRAAPAAPNANLYMYMGKCNSILVRATTTICSYIDCAELKQLSVQVMLTHRKREATGSGLGMKCMLLVTCSQHACSTRCLLTSLQQDGPLRSPDRRGRGYKVCTMTKCTISAAVGASLLLLLSVSCQTGFACSEIGLPLAGARSERSESREGSELRQGDDDTRPEIGAGN